MMIINFERTCPKCGGFGDETTCQGCGKILAQDEWVKAIEDNRRYTVKYDAYYIDAVLTGRQLVAFAEEYMKPIELFCVDTNLCVAKWLSERGFYFAPITEEKLSSAIKVFQIVIDMETKIPKEREDVTERFKHQHIVAKDAIHELEFKRDALKGLCGDVYYEIEGIDYDSLNIPKELRALVPKAA